VVLLVVVVAVTARGDNVVIPNDEETDLDLLLLDMLLESAFIGETTGRSEDRLL
jgi:hypothetical protein